MPRIAPISSQKLGKVFEKAGFRRARQRGSHRMYIKAGVARPVVIPMRKDVPVSTIKSNLRSAGISREEYFRLLSEI